MKRLLILTPHLSTGGAPEVTANKVELLINEFEIMVVEHAFIAWDFVVQRNKILNLVGENFRSLGEDKFGELRKIIDDFRPEVISVEEFPEMFLSNEISDWLYDPNRDYTIVETTHDSSFNPKHKRYLPDRFVFVSPYNSLKYMHLNIPYEVIEYPIDRVQRVDKATYRKMLGLEDDYKHIVIVGLFTPRKNQKYAFELCDKLHEYKIKFHFLGNQAGNFENYWKPLMEWKSQNERLNNCVVWGERSDVDVFMKAVDLFLFPSKGERSNKELNPIAIKEAIKYSDLPKLMYNLDVYLNKYHDEENMNYLVGDLNIDAQKIVEILNVKPTLKDELIIIGTYPNLDERVKLTKECIQRAKKLGRKILLLSHYPVDEETQKMCDYYLYDQHNPLTHHSYYNRFYNYTPNYDAVIFINSLKNSNQSLTVLTNLYNGFKLAKSQGFKKAFYFTFDILLQDEDVESIEQSFEAIQGDKKAFLASINTPFGKGIQTNGMTFDVDYFLNTFDDVRDGDTYNKICEDKGSQNFLEDYLIKALQRVDSNSYEIVHNQEETFLKKSGLGVSSNSEYYSILPIEGQDNQFMFYFFSYNLDERKVNITIYEDGLEIFNTRFQINKTREYKKDFTFNNKPITLVMDFYDGERNYKSEKYEISNHNLSKYKNAGTFKWKNKRPKIKLVHIQVSSDDERQRQSRESLSRVSNFNWEYVLHTNVPYNDLPPKFNCNRGDCVSMELFDEARVNKLGTALTPSHYGCYESFKNAILGEFDSDVDFLMVCEGDCIIEIDTQEFVEKVEKCCEYLNNHRIGYMSFGDKDTLEHGWSQSPIVETIPNQDLMYITNHIIGIQSIMFPKFTRKWLKETLLTHKWDAADLYFNLIFSKSEYKMGIVYDRMTTQADGYSLIDKQFKTFRKR
jgi:glycosyltransferase involved in cell wall biosynthesis